MSKTTVYRLAVLCFVVAACGDDGANPNNDDAGVDDDALIDAPPPVEFMCPVGGGPPVCTPTVVPTVPIAGGPVCNPLTQAGCGANEKCTWIEDQDNPPIGHVGCTPVGTVPVGCACTTGAAGPMGYDDCVGGALCLSGTCKTICDHLGGAPTCGANYSCTRYADVFETGGTTVAGVCDPGCDPLTQCLHGSTTPEACGSMNPAIPNRGCYGYDDFSCAPVGMTVLTLTDRMMPRTNASGNPYLNGCAPGFIPLFYEMTGSTRTLCTGLCAALEVDNTPAHVGNALGDPFAPGKLPAAMRAMTGDATCAIGKKGSEASSTCRFLWTYVVDDATGEVPPQFIAAGHLDKLGACMAIDHFMYDSNNDLTPDATYPSCTTLPPRSAATTGDFDDAADWGCQKQANSMFTGTPRVNPVLRDIRVLGSRATLQLARHRLE